MIRPELRAALWRWREVLAAGGVVAFGLWAASFGGLVLVPFGLVAAALGIGLGVQAVRRLRFMQGADAPGIVEVDEAQISYMGPEFGGFVNVPDLIELRLVRMRGRRLWRFRQSDGQALLVPVDAAGAEALFDVFATLPGLDMAAARQALALRERGHWTSLSAAQQALGAAARPLDDKQHSVQSRYFEVLGRMRINQVVQQERSLVRRDGNQVRMVWRIQSPQMGPLQ